MIEKREKQSVEYARIILNVSDGVHSTLYNLLNSYRDRDAYRTL